MPTFEDILKRESIIIDQNVLSPHYVPNKLLHRDNEIEQIMTVLAPALKNQRISNLFIYGKTGTGKTASVKHVMNEFQKYAKNAIMVYANCRVYNSRYKAMQKCLQELFPQLEKMGFGIQFFYEKLLEYLNSDRKNVV